MWDFLWKALSKVLPFIQGRIERLKNEKARLLNERKKLLDAVITPESACRIVDIDFRVQSINEALGNKATD